VRCTAPGRLPITGPVDAVGQDAVGQDAAGQPGLWVCTGMGARGLTLSLLCAELLAARLHAEPLPLEAKLAQALSTERLSNR
jgi:tRNA 5-methylaminomethyl-2-thiouridine biosynthesis bifunctional protein